MEKVFDISVFLASKGYGTLSRDWYINNIDYWMQWYKGNVDKFHEYTVYNGTQSISCRRHSLGMAKKVCEDKADLILNERVTVSCGDEPTQKYLIDALHGNNFWVRGNQLVEFTAALGTGAFVEYLDGKNAKIDYIKAPNIYPMSWSNGEITECAFASAVNRKDAKGFYISIHTQNERGMYVVDNFLLDEEGKEKPLPDDIAPKWETGSKKPMFQILRMNICNNIDTSNPMGISIFANAIDVLKGVDIVYDSYDNEFVMGRKRIFIDASMMNVSVADGTVKPVFDPRDAVFYGFNAGGDGNEHLRESNMSLRAAEHDTALQTRLDILSDKVGFGRGYYKFSADGVKTATEVISQNSKLFRKIKRDEIILEKVLIDLCRAILFLSKKPENVEININFDDSIIEDVDAEAKRALLELQSGVIDRVEYHKRVYKLTEDAAVKLIAEMDARAPAQQDFNLGAGEDDNV